MLNDKARSIYDYMVRSAEERGFPPTIREIGEEFGIRSTNGVRHYLTQLEGEGYIRRDKRISRGIILQRPSSLPKAPNLRVADGGRRREDVGIPILGGIAAGLPISAVEEVEGYVTMDEMFPSRDDVFALRVRGESMKNRGVLDGDLVVVRRQAHARDGDMVAALVGDDATVKTFRRTGDAVELVPENPDFSTLTVGAHDDFRVLGVVVGLVRPMKHG